MFCRTGRIFGSVGIGIVSGVVGCRLRLSLARFLSITSFSMTIRVSLVLQKCTPFSAVCISVIMYISMALHVEPKMRLLVVLKIEYSPCRCVCLWVSVCRSCIYKQCFRRSALLYYYQRLECQSWFPVILKVLLCGHLQENRRVNKRRSCRDSCGKA